MERSGDSGEGSPVGIRGRRKKVRELPAVAGWGRGKGGGGAVEGVILSLGVRRECRRLLD